MTLLELLHQMSVKRLLEMKQESETVSDTRKLDLSIMVFYIRYFAVQCLKDVHSKKRQNIKNTMCPEKCFM